MSSQTAEDTSKIQTKGKTEIAPISLPNEFPYRLIGNSLILGLIFVLASITLTLRNDLINKQLINLQETIYDLTAEMGFTIDDIIVRGRKNTSMDSLQKSLTLSRETNILSVNTDEIRHRIEELPWIRSASVSRRFFPNIIQIDIDEHEVTSLWQYNESFHPIDENGNVIEADYYPKKEILLIVGAGAPEHITELLNIIKKDTEIFQRIKAANFISERRWDLILDDINHGITIKLPEQEISEAWEKLIKLNHSKNILKRKLTKIDLRLKNKVIVTIEKTEKKPSKGSVKERKI